MRPLGKEINSRALAIPEAVYMEEYMMCAQLMHPAEYIQRLAWQVFSRDRRERERAAHAHLTGARGSTCRRH